MLIRLAKHSLCRKQVCFISGHQPNPSTYSFNSTKLLKISQQHIQKANTINELLSGINLLKIAEKPEFRSLMRKLTLLLQENKTNAKELASQMQRLLYELKRFTSTEINSSSSDLLNFQLFFKQMIQNFPKTYSSKGFEIRTTMLAENMPKIASMEGCEPVSMALFHYLSTISELSTDRIKVNLENYFYRYFISQKLSQTPYKVNQEQLKNRIEFDPNVILVLLSCISSRKTKTFRQSLISSISVLNVNKKFDQVSRYLNIAQIQYLYFTKYQNKNSSILTEQQLKQIKHALSTNPKLQHLSNLLLTTDQLVINTLEKFLQTADTFVNLIRYDYRNLTNSQKDQKATQNLSIYLYMVFLASQQMKINVYDVLQPKHWQSHQIEDIIVPNKNHIKKIPLWKICAQIVEGLVQRNIYVSNKNKMLELFFDKTISYLKSHNKTLDQSVKQHLSSLIRIFTFMPVQIIKRKLEKQPSLRGIISQSIYNCFTNFDPQAEQSLEIIKSLIRFGQLKKTMLMSKKDWIKLTRLIKSKQNYFDCFHFYMFLAKTQDIDLINQIPIDKIVNLISQQRQQMQIKQHYVSIEQSEITKEADQSTEMYSKFNDSRNWEVCLLKTHSLILQMGLESKLAQILSKSPTYQIGQAELNSIFESWMRPFKLQIISHLTPFGEKTETNKQFEFRFENTRNKDKPVAFFEKYFQNIFIDSGFPKSTALTHKIITSPTFEQGFKQGNEMANYHFFAYFSVFLFGLSDQTHQKKYEEMFDLSKVFPSNLRPNSLFKFEFDDTLKQIHNEKQWEKFLEVTQHLKSTYQGKDTYNMFRNQINIQNQCSAEVQINNKIQASKFDLGEQKINNYISVAKYSKNFKKINKMIIKALIDDLLYPSAYESSYDKKLIHLGKHIIDVIQLQNDYTNFSIENFIGKKDSQRILEVFDRYKMLDNPTFAEIIYCFSILDLFTKEKAEYFLKTINFSNQVSYTKAILLSILGKQLAIQKGLTTEEEWKSYEVNLSRISSQQNRTTKWIQISLIFADKQRLPYFKKLINSIVNPMQRKILINSYKKAHKKHHLSDIQDSDIVDEANIQFDNFQYQISQNYDHIINDTSLEGQKQGTKSSLNRNFNRNEGRRQKKGGLFKKKNIEE